MEDRLSAARQHVAEGERRIAAQRQLIERLVNDGHDQLAADARSLLDNLETSLRLARQDLQRIERQG